MNNFSKTNLKGVESSTAVEYFFYDRMPKEIKTKLQNAPVDFATVDVRKIYIKYGLKRTLEIIDLTISKLEPLVKS